MLFLPPFGHHDLDNAGSTFVAEEHLPKGGLASFDSFLHIWIKFVGILMAWEPLSKFSLVLQHQLLWFISAIMDLFRPTRSNIKHLVRKR